ncbi:MAG TPA: hypothetical protein VHQ47_18015 [Phycisphaerae bacterium]|nr:hypothetical protein [Phycisphaerae bacterium]
MSYQSDKRRTEAVVHSVRREAADWKNSAPRRGARYWMPDDSEGIDAQTKLGAEKIAPLAKDLVTYWSNRAKRSEESLGVFWLQIARNVGRQVIAGCTEIAPTCSGLGGIVQDHTWIFRKVMSKLRREGHDRRAQTNSQFGQGVEDGFVLRLAGTFPTPSQAAETAEEIETVRAAVDALGPDDAQAFSDYCNGCTCIELGPKYGVTPAVMQLRIRRALWSVGTKLGALAPPPNANLGKVPLPFDPRLINGHRREQYKGGFRGVAEVVAVEQWRHGQTVLYSMEEHVRGVESVDVEASPNNSVAVLITIHRGHAALPDAQAIAPGEAARFAVGEFYKLEASAKGAGQRLSVSHTWSRRMVG